MDITHDAAAGTLESSDLMVKVAPAASREVHITSAVMTQFGDQIRQVVDETLDRLHLTTGQIVIEDKGALDCTIRARVQAAVLRGSDQSNEASIDWSVIA